ncbi:MAG: hypothetical protein Q8P73_04425 [bacterium]|nr:hypothetical protein [bacterium]
MKGEPERALGVEGKSNLHFDIIAFCGILAEWLSNIKENPIQNVSFVLSLYIKDPLRSKGIKAEYIAVWLATVLLLGKKYPVRFARSP